MYKLMLKENVQLICVFNKILTEYIMATHKRCNSYLITTNQEEGAGGNLLQNFATVFEVTMVWTNLIFLNFSDLLFILIFNNKLIFCVCSIAKK